MNPPVSRPDRARSVRDEQRGTSRTLTLKLFAFVSTQKLQPKKGC